MAKARATDKGRKADNKKKSDKASKTKSTRPAAPAKAAAEKPASKAEAKASAAKPPVNGVPAAVEVRAHPDAKLAKAEVQVLYQKLVDERNRVVSGFDRHVSEALEDGDLLADEIDIAQRSTDQAWLFRFADKERKLLIEIDAALDKLRTAEYGICEGTDEPIGYKRLELRPWTRYSVAYKEMLEREKAQQAR